ncbi:type VII secretion protein EccB [Catenuloplanes japonicus]|uniref:type VII secretion protein EccB n=1 Tax=Catenuloplanes japonicus TaxID=33876 RepID=UPI0006912B23|nr:type VII secretion protein EccB [Catenuloplanes japonicus]
MWTQRDQLQAYRFLRRRVVSAVQFGDANHPIAPGRRTVIATASGTGAALLAAVAVLVYSVFRPGTSADWRRPGQIVIEKESGAGFVLGADGLLHPVLNHASARLLIGGGRTVSITAARLADAPRGMPLGIPDAPATLPARNQLITGPWAVCTEGTETTLIIGGLAPPPAGQDRPDDRRSLDDRALLVTGPDDDRHLITAGRRMALQDGAAVALGYDAVQPRPVTREWLDAIPEGPPLAPLAVEGAGRQGPRLGGNGQRSRSGQVLRTEDVGGASRYYLVTTTALRPITETEAALIVGNPANRAAYPDGEPRALPVPAADIAADLVENGDDNPGYPDRLPDAVPGGDLADALCTADGTLWTAGGPPLPANARALPAPENQATAADAVWLPPGTGVLIGGDDDTPSYLVGDRGIRYPLADADAAKALGYDGVRASVPPKDLVSLLPVGPELSVQGARQEFRR